MKVRKQNESGDVPDSFYILEGSVPLSFSLRKFKIKESRPEFCSMVKKPHLQEKGDQIEFFTIQDETGFNVLIHVGKSITGRACSKTPAANASTK
jgi:hypothetical protein